MKKLKSYIWIGMLFILELSAVLISIKENSKQLELILFMWIALWCGIFYFAAFGTKRHEKIGVKDVITGIPDGGAGTNMMKDIYEKESKIKDASEFFLDNLNVFFLILMILGNIIAYTLVSKR